MSQTVTIQPDAIRQEVIDAVRMVGKIVTYQGGQYKIHSVEGIDFYAFGSKVTGDNTITCDLAMTHGYRHAIYTYLLPMGCKVGEGFGFEVPLSQVSRGVCLVKDRW